MEQRIWLRQKWTRKVAMLDGTGLLKVSSSSIYDKLQYYLSGGQAVIIDEDPADNGERRPPRIQIKLDPTVQLESLEGGSAVIFRLLSEEDIGPWIQALSRSCAAHASP